jgi:hypothetical protein
MPLQATSGAASYDGFGGGVAAIPNYIEDVFSTYLYTGNGSTAPETQTINNGIDLSTNGGLVWIKNRSVATNNALFDTARGATKQLVSNSTAAQSTDASTLTSFNNNGFSVYYGQGVNGQNNPIASWTFREQPKFFDVVTWSGNSVSGRQISHALGSTPGCIIVKCTSTSGDDWIVYHRSLGRSSAIFLNLTSASGSYAYWDGTDPTSTNFTVSSNGSVNGTGETYVAYLFAHNAGGFGLTGTDNVISCGSYTGNGSTTGPVINLGYEPQWVMIKNATNDANWVMYDTMRGFTNGGIDATLFPNLSAAEDATNTALIRPLATGFQPTSTSGTRNASGDTYIYIAIRRGPMKVPTDATKVFIPVFQDTTSNQIVTTNFAVDLSIQRQSNNPTSTGVIDKLRGTSSTYTTRIYTNLTAAEAVSPTDGLGMFNTYMQDNVGARSSMIFWNFQRAPSFFDEVCYTGTGADPQTIAHNLTVVPELMIVKCRSNTGDWPVAGMAVTTSSADQFLRLNSTNGRSSGSDYFASTYPTASNFYVSGNLASGGSGRTYVAYLFATCAGVSKVGSYTGTGTTQTIDCGFTAGARFVLIKKTSGTGSWYVWDSARGIVSGNDPYLLLNSTAAEVTNTDYIDTYSAGFEISSTAPSEINESGGTFIFLAIA